MDAHQLSCCQITSGLLKNFALTRKELRTASQIRYAISGNNRAFEALRYANSK